MKQIPALIAALVITAIIGVAMFAVGANALMNTNTLPVTNGPASASSAADPNLSQAQDQIQQLQSLVAQYQSREQQYQQQLNQATQQLNQENAQIQSFQELLLELQRRGVIMIRSDGRILIPGG
jgi:septal ring factor EnvC (AmiA/AmiB activator)